ncbi:DUF934 domain-containing protein [Qipengyuania sp. MTN3-11]|uniref:DUF934 domain-containing protein n=1 Tax=Qipengyuania sp. MTN3-11 TaxID=3056557 RepID=UPI0036F2D73D
MPLLDKGGLATDATEFVDLDALEEEQADRGPGDRFGVRVPCDVDGEELARRAGSAGAIAIEVPRTGDGRVFSLAATLRERGYHGIIRAVGPLIPDQFAFALACGIDQVEITDEQLARQPLDQWLASAGTISRTYVGSDGIFARRSAA